MDQQTTYYASVSEMSEDLRRGFEELAAALGAVALRKQRVPLAGPNDILETVMSFQLWGLTVPWALKNVAGGVLAAIGAQVVNRFIPNATQKQLNEIGSKLDKIITDAEQQRTGWNARWDLRFGLSGSDIDNTRCIVGGSVGNSSEAAQIAIMLALIGEEVDRITTGFLATVKTANWGTGVQGMPELGADGTIAVKLWMQDGDDVKRLELTRHPDGRFTRGPLQIGWPKPQ